MRTTLFLAALLTATCDGPAPQLSMSVLDASAIPPDDAAPAMTSDGENCGAVDADPVDLATDADMACPRASRACGRLCCALACCSAVCLPLAWCADGSFNDGLTVIEVGVCC
jgi:hypothetical protein